MIVLRSHVCLQRLAQSVALGALDPKVMDSSPRSALLAGLIRVGALARYQLTIAGSNVHVNGSVVTKVVQVQTCLVCYDFPNSSKVDRSPLPKS